MKKTMKKMIAALLAITCLPLHAMTIVHADEPEILWYWGTASGDTFKDMEHIETLSGVNFAASRSGTSHETYLRTFTRYDGNTGYQLYTVTSRDRILQFRLRDGLDANEVMPQILEVVDKYYPGLAANYQPRYGAKVPADASDYRYADYMFYCAVTPSLEEDTFELRDCRPEEPSAEIGDSIRKALAAKGLISEFYNWGQTAEYQQLQQGHRNLLTYAKYHDEVVGEKKNGTMLVQETGATQEDFQKFLAGYHVDLEDLRSLYTAQNPDPFDMLALEEGLQYYRLAGQDENGKAVRFYKLVKGDHEQYYADASDQSVSRYLASLAQDSELYMVGEGEIKPTIIKHGTDSGKTKTEYRKVANNIDAIRSYLAEHYPDYSLNEYGEGNPVIEYVEVIPSDELSYPEQVRLMGELYQASGMRPGFMILESSEGGEAVTGRNAMERPGDTNLDGEVDILDVIAANKHILGVGTLDKTGLKNADMDGNGMADSEDALAILKEVINGGE